MAAIVAMRSKRDAPVDSLGCEGFFKEDLPVRIARFHVLVGALLSSQTKDPVTAAAMGRLRAMPGGLTVDTVRGMDEATLAELLHPVGFRHNKAKYLKASAQLLVERHGGCVPDTKEDLVKLPGIGPKMAFLVLSVAFNKHDGICVDVSQRPSACCPLFAFLLLSLTPHAITSQIHVHRISNRLGWVNTWTAAKNQGPEATRLELESWLPRKHWGPINVLLVGLGQQICTPVSPKCESCTAKNMCPSAFTKVTGSPGRKMKSPSQSASGAKVSAKPKVTRSIVERASPSATGASGDGKVGCASLKRGAAVEGGGRTTRRRKSTR